MEWSVKPTNYIWLNPNTYRTELMDAVRTRDLPQVKQILERCPNHCIYHEILEKAFQSLPEFTRVRQEVAIQIVLSHKLQTLREEYFKDRPSGSP